MDEETEADVTTYIHTHLGTQNKTPKTAGVPLKKMEETSYFFRMSKYKARLVEHIKASSHFILPDSRRNLILGAWPVGSALRDRGALCGVVLTRIHQPIHPRHADAVQCTLNPPLTTHTHLKTNKPARLEEDLMDLSISRTTFDWGIPVPAGFEPGHVLYVWFDALSNYLSGIDFFLPGACYGVTVVASGVVCVDCGGVWGCDPFHANCAGLFDFDSDRFVHSLTSSPHAQHPQRARPRGSGPRACT